MTKRDFARNLIPTMRSWSETVFRSALSSRSQHIQNQVIETLYNNYENEIAENPEGHAMDYIHIIMEIEKE